MRVERRSWVQLRQDETVVYLKKTKKQFGLVKKERNRRKKVGMEVRVVRSNERSLLFRKSMSYYITSTLTKRMQTR